MSPEGIKLIKGIRVRNGSIKVYSMLDGKYLVQIKKYLWKVTLIKKNIIVSNYEQAEDFILSAKNDGEILKRYYGGTPV